MSYLRRVAQRAAGVTGAGLMPAGRSTSPLASFDQRLNLVPSLASGARRADGSTSSIDGGIDSLTDPFATAAASPLGVSAGSIDATAGRAAVAPQAARSSTERPAFSAASPVAFPSPVPGAPTGAPSLGDSLPGVAALAENARQPHATVRTTVRSSAQPGDARAPLAEAARATAEVAGARAKEQRTALGATQLRDSGARADERAGQPAPSLPRAREAARTPAPFGAPEAPGRGRDPVADALAKLDRWLGSDPRAEGKSRPVPGADQRGEAGTAARGGAAPGPRAPAAARRLLGGRGGPSLHAAPPAPILRIGRIEVQVVLPAPPAAIVTAAPRPRASSPAAASSGSWWGPPAHLTFGLRQR